MRGAPVRLPADEPPVSGASLVCECEMACASAAAVCHVEVRFAARVSPPPPGGLPLLPTRLRRGRRAVALLRLLPVQHQLDVFPSHGRAAARPARRTDGAQAAAAGAPPIRAPNPAPNPKPRCARSCSRAPLASARGSCQPRASRCCPSCSSSSSTPSPSTGSPASRTTRPLSR